MSHSRPKWPSGAQSFFFVFALLSGLLAGALIYDTPASYPGWMFAFMALNFAIWALPNSQESRTTFDLPKGKAVGILALCVLPPLIVMLIFGHRPGWGSPLVWLFLICISIGPIVLFRHRERRIAKALKQSSEPEVVA
jgi:hypothetical protein